MMNSFNFQTKKPVLFVGEGNFSFCYTLIKNSDATFFKNIFVSCLEKEEDSIISKEIRSYLEEKGVNIIFAVDGTNLSNHSMLSKLTFKKIIFNFPHVGGKMKIHLNRQLLQDFFLNSSLLLDKEGEIVVTLCAGQGGTPAEKKKRKWEDTWQIVEMAARSGLVLKDTKCFPNELFSTYISTGYRGIKKSFNTKDAIIHVFHMGLPLLMNVDVVMNKNKIWHLHNRILIPYVYKNKLANSPYTNANSPQTYLVEVLEDICRSIVKDYLVDGETVLFTKTSDDSGQVQCIVDGEICYLRKNLLQVCQKRVDDDEKHIIIKGLSFNKFTEDFSKAPAECHIAVFGPQRNEICNRFIQKMQYLFQYYLCDKSKENIILTMSDWFQQNGFSQNGIDINIDLILTNVFSMSWHQLWSPEINVRLEGQHLLIAAPSIYFQTFSFDISYVSSNDIIDIKQLLILVQQINCDLIVRTFLLNTFKSQRDGFKTIYCFRFIYRSYSSALSRKNALTYHNLVGRAIEEIMHLKIV